MERRSTGFWPVTQGREALLLILIPFCLCLPQDRTIVKSSVGLRPCRRGGVRLQMQEEEGSLTVILFKLPFIVLGLVFLFVLPYQTAPETDSSLSLCRSRLISTVETDNVKLAFQVLFFWLIHKSRVSASSEVTRITKIPTRSIHP